MANFPSIVSPITFTRPNHANFATAELACSPSMPFHYWHAGVHTARAVTRDKGGVCPRGGCTTPFVGIFFCWLKIRSFLQEDFNTPARRPLGMSPFYRQGGSVSKAGSIKAEGGGVSQKQLSDSSSRK